MTTNTFQTKYTVSCLNTRGRWNGGGRIHRNYYTVTFISGTISSQGKQYQPKAEGRGMIPFFEGWCGARYESNYDIIYLSLIYYKKNWNKISTNYQFFFFLFVSSLVSSIFIGLVRTLLDVFTIFFSFLGLYFHIFVNFLCYVPVGLIQIMSKSSRKVSNMSAIWFCDIVYVVSRTLIRISASKLKCSQNRRFAGFINRHLATSHWTNYNVSG